jgi:hypothetical protein
VLTWAAVAAPAGPRILGAQAARRSGRPTQITNQPSVHHTDPTRIATGDGSVWVTAMRVLSYTGASADATVFRIDPATNRVVARIPLHTRVADGIIVSHGLVWVAVPQSQ